MIQKKRRKVGLSNHVRSHKERKSLSPDSGGKDEAGKDADPMEVDDTEEKKGTSSKGKKSPRNDIVEKPSSEAKSETQSKVESVPEKKSEVKQMVTSLLESRIAQVNVENLSPEKLRSKMSPLKIVNGEDPGETPLADVDDEINSTPKIDSPSEEKENCLEPEIRQEDFAKENVNGDSVQLPLEEEEEEMTRDEILPKDKSDSTSEIIDSIKTSILDDVAAELENLSKKEEPSPWEKNGTSIAKFFCCKCQKGFAKDDEMVFHQAEC